MPPFISAECPYCHNKNRFDLLELLKITEEVHRGASPSPAQETREIVVRCQHCHRSFKVFVPAEGKVL